MNKHLKYFKYIMRHKWFVFYAGWKYVGTPLWNLIIHDWSKFLPSEWFPYVNLFYGDERDRDENAFNVAWLKHQHRNPHHWQYWLLTEDNPANRLKTVGSSDTRGAFPIEIPSKYVYEMLADWMGAGKAISGKWEVWVWYEKNKENIVLHENTRILVEFYMYEMKRLFSRRGDQWKM